MKLRADLKGSHTGQDADDGGLMLTNQVPDGRVAALVTAQGHTPQVTHNWLYNIKSHVCNILINEIHVTFDSRITLSTNLNNNRFNQKY